MQITILRSETSTAQAYTLPERESTLLKALTYIKANTDATLTFSF